MADATVHLRLIDEPATLGTMVAWLHEVFEGAGLTVDVASTERLDAPDLLDIRLDGCGEGSVPTSDVLSLYARRAGCGRDDIVVYFVRQTVPVYSGCAQHPPGYPGAVVVNGASVFTLAHEVCHVLGLNHVGDERRIMYTPTAHIDPVPIIDGEEVRIIRGEVARPPRRRFAIAGEVRASRWEGPVPDLRRALEEDEPDYESLAVPGVVDMAELGGLIGDTDPLLASKAAYLAGLVGGAGSLTVLRDAATRPEPQVRVAVAGAVRHLAPPEGSWGPEASRPGGRRSLAPPSPLEELVASLAADADPGVVRMLGSSLSGAG